MRTSTIAAAAKSVVIAAALCCLSVETTAQSDAPPPPTPKWLLHWPAVNRSHLIFVHANDLWVVSRQGGIALPLTSSAEPESAPRFSPDGRFIAFAANYDGNWNLYTLPVEGGSPFQLTHHPASKALCGWVGNDRLLFSSDVLGPPIPGQLFTVSAGGGLPKKLPVPYGIDAAISADGQWLAYTMHDVPGSWKRYRGGNAPDIWLFNLQDKSARKVTEWEGVDSLPMWHGGALYYLSDAGDERRRNLWRYERLSGAREQVTRFSEFDVRQPSIGPDHEIVFMLGSKLMLFDLVSGEADEVKVEFKTERRKLRPRSVDVTKFISYSQLSERGGAIVAQARGDIWLIAASGGSSRNLTRTSEVLERYPAWSPDGKWIACVSDAGGEYQLSLLDPGGTAGPRRLASRSPAFMYQPVWSPDAARIVYSDGTGTIFLHTMATGRTVAVDRNPLGPQSDLSWSPDSQWLVYARGSQNRFLSLWLYDVQGARTFQATSGMFHDTSPVFDPLGRYLFFISQRDFSSPVLDAVVGNSFVHPYPKVLLAVPLRPDAAYPWKPGPSAQSGELPEPPAAMVSAQGFESRAVVLPAPKGDLSGLAVSADGKIIYSHVSPGGEHSIRLLDLSDSSRQTKSLVNGVSQFRISAGRDQVLVRKDDAFYLLEIAPDQKLSSPISPGTLVCEIDPRVEWRHIFNDAWRRLRDFFYDANLHRVDWEAVRSRYGDLLDGCAAREDVNFLINEMIGELNTSHCGIGNGGDLMESKPAPVGMLGADFELHEGAYRFQRIYSGAAWDTDARSPLLQSGVKEGDYLLAVNHVPLDTRKDPWAAFQGLAGRMVTLTISQQSVMSPQARSIPVEPLQSERHLRYRAWVEESRSYVERKTEGRVGYLHIPDTYDDGIRELTRSFYGQIHKESLIIDVRWNSGGRGPDRLLELLNRSFVAQDFDRNGNDWRYPQFSHLGPKCMLINGWAGSGGDNLPYQFRKAGLGKLIGTRTAGALLAGTVGPSLMDGGSIYLPVRAPYGTDGNWIIEGYGVAPDIEVAEDPALMVHGGDPQLDAAIELMKEEGKTRPWTAPPRPSSPNRAANDFPRSSDR